MGIRVLNRSRARLIGAVAATVITILACMYGIHHEATRVRGYRAYQYADNSIIQALRSITMYYDVHGRLPASDAGFLPGSIVPQKGLWSEGGSPRRAFNLMPPNDPYNMMGRQWSYNGFSGRRSDVPETRNGGALRYAVHPTLPLCIVASCGPDGDVDIDLDASIDNILSDYPLDKQYDPTNGALSNGDMLRIRKFISSDKGQ